MFNLPELDDLLQRRKERKEYCKSLIDTKYSKELFKKEEELVEAYITSNFSKLDKKDQELSEDVDFLVKAHSCLSVVPFFLTISYDLYFMSPWSRLRKFVLFPFVLVVFPYFEFYNCLDMKTRLRLHLLETYREKALLTLTSLPDNPNTGQHPD
jgi:hypothetical protein